MKKLNIALVGLGRMGKFHLEVLSKLKNVNLLCSLTTSKINLSKKKIFQKYNIKKNYTNINKMLLNEKIDVAFIQPSVHKVYEISKIFIKNKINCLIEKPPGLSVEEAKKLSTLIKKYKIIHAIGLNRRFYSNINLIAKYKKNLGKLYSVNVEAPEKFDDIKKKKKFNKKVLEKWFITNGIHMIDLMHFLIGSKYYKIYSISRKINEKIKNSFNAIIKYRNGVVANYISNWKTTGGWQIKLYFTKGIVIISPIEKTIIKFNSGRIIDIQLSEYDKKFKQGLFLQNKKFIESCLNKSPLDKRTGTIDDAINAMNLIKKIKA